MSKQKTAYSCQECGAIHHQWSGRCADCSSWNQLVEVALTQSSGKQSESRSKKYKGFAAEEEEGIVQLGEITATETTRFSTGVSELDRVLGGGLVLGSVVLMGGDPGIGKSTVLLQTLSNLSHHSPTLYVTGEESLQQVKLRAERLELGADSLQLLAETQVERILNLGLTTKPKIMVIDSIQTMYTELLQSAPGSVAQVRESAAQFVQFAKQTNTAIFLVGHVTKEGALAGPRVLEHMVDTVLYFEGQTDNRFRMIRAIKNRFGAVNELGIFAMTEKGLKGVTNPSAIFLSRFSADTSGSIVTVTWEGTRPMLVEVQALVDESHLGNPRRVTVGLDPNRLSLILAVLHRHGGIFTYNQDVYINVVGGVKVTETAADLPVILAVLSSLKNKPLPRDLIVFGEVGLGGEIRPVQSGQERLKEALKHGFKRAIVPKMNAPKESLKGMEIIAVERLNEALAHI